MLYSRDWKSEDIYFFFIFQYGRHNLKKKQYLCLYTTFRYYFVVSWWVFRIIVTSVNSFVTYSQSKIENAARMAIIITIWPLTTIKIGGNDGEIAVAKLWCEWNLVWNLSDGVWWIIGCHVYIGGGNDEIRWKIAKSMKVVLCKLTFLRFRISNY